MLNLLSGETRLKGLTTILVAGLLFVSQMSQALFISQDSSLGTGSITLDTSTGIEWVDPYLPNTFGTYPLSYGEVKTELASGGLLDGFRFATESELSSLLFSSLGYGPLSSQIAPSASDKAAAETLFSFFGSTFSISYGPDYKQMILDAVYETGVPGQLGRTILSGGKLGSSLLGGSIDAFTMTPTAYNYDPYGFWLVRDSFGVAVSEPSSFALLMLGVLSLLIVRRRTRI